GSGKSHLMMALVDQVRQQMPRASVSVLRAGEEEWPSVEREEGSVSERRASDLLIVEDIQHLESRHSPGLVSLFDYLQTRQVPMVFTSALSPWRLELPPRLLSRLTGGLVVELEPLQTASRLVLLQDRLQRRQLAISGEVLTWLAEHLTSGRQLE